jgi:hypothetical protein
MAKFGDDPKFVVRELEKKASKPAVLRSALQVAEVLPGFRVIGTKIEYSSIKQMRPTKRRLGVSKGQVDHWKLGGYAGKRRADPAKVGSKKH